MTETAARTFKPVSISIPTCFPLIPSVRITGSCLLPLPTFKEYNDIKFFSCPQFILCLQILDSSIFFQKKYHRQRISETCSITIHLLPCPLVLHSYLTLLEHNLLLTLSFVHTIILLSHHTLIL